MMGPIHNHVSSAYNSKVETLTICSMVSGIWPRSELFSLLSRYVRQLNCFALLHCQRDVTQSKRYFGAIYLLHIVEQRFPVPSRIAQFFDSVDLVFRRSEDAQEIILE